MSNTEGALSRQSWTDAALNTLANGGIDAVRVEALAKTLDVTKGSFYWHFTDRRDLHTAALERWEELATDRIIEQVDSLPSTEPLDRLRGLAHAVFEVDQRSARLETAIRTWAAADDVALEVVERVDKRRLRYVSGLLLPIGHSAPSARRRARLLYRTLIGEFLWRSAGGPASTNAELDDLVAVLASPGGQRDGTVAP